jgi:HAMP domain-containing protein
MYARRLGDLPDADLNVLRGIEGARMKETYRSIAREFGIECPACGVEATAAYPGAAAILRTHRLGVHRPRLFHVQGLRRRLPDAMVEQVSAFFQPRSGVLSVALAQRCAVAALAALLLVTMVSSAWLARDTSSLQPASMQLSESSRGGSTPADKVQGSATSELGYVELPTTLLPPPKPDVLPLAWCEIGAFRPGHPPRIDRPPRRSV